MRIVKETVGGEGTAVNAQDLELIGALARKPLGFRCRGGSSAGVGAGGSALARRGFSGSSSRRRLAPI